ncbi:TadE/TadG family type IV pilus assembly protein [Sphingomonas tabacisoli]|uniref:TadE/TadG family type IV pilus assembly protein n=1 Tax=Sphingomonas tabacisoli TaxID=2249466 RepID=A0ABW4I7V0_9SPHN
MIRTRFAARLLHDNRGSPIAEFAVVAPTMLLLIMGAMDLSYRSYATSLLEGEIQKAARDSGMENQSDKLDAIETKVKNQVRLVVKAATFTPLRRSYTSYLTDKPERFTDTNGNGQRDAGECFDDVNGNGQWDSDPGNAGQGGANDVAAYTMTMSYPRLFPMAAMLGWSSTQTITVKTFLRNQPYATQNVPVVKNLCT